MDRNLFGKVNRFADRTAWLHGPMRLYAKYGIGLFAVLLLVAWWQARASDAPIRNVSGAVWAGVSALLAIAINQPIGSAVGRARPYDTLSNVHILLDRTKDFSFPSDHATAAGAVAAGLLLANRKLGIAALLAAILMAFARVYAGAHYPGDVLAGLLLGATIAIALSSVARKLIAPGLKRLSDTPFRLLVAREQ